MTLTEKLNRLPPCICRLLAARNGELATDHEMRLVTGWSRAKLERVSKSTSWAGITVDDVDSFLLACGISWSSQRKERWKLSRIIKAGGVHRLKHLQKPIAQRAGRVATLLKRTEELLKGT